MSKYCKQLSLKNAAELALISSRSPYSRKEWLRTKLVMRMGIMVLCVFIQVGISYPMGDFTTALTEKDPGRFYEGVKKFTVIAIAAAPLFALDDWSSKMVYLIWRKAMTKDMLGEYLQNRAFFHLSRHRHIDNPGQRILNDIQSFIHSVISLLELLVEHFAQLLGFSYILFTLDYRMLPALVLYAGFGTLFVVSVFGGKLKDLSATLLKQNAGVQAYVVRVRENSESIAFFKAEMFETGIIWAMFLELCQTLTIEFKWLAFLRCFKNAYRYITICIPYIILATPYFEGKVKFGQISQAALAFRHLLSSLNLVITKINKLTSLSATTDRITSLQKAIDECAHVKPPRLRSIIRNEREENVGLLSCEYSSFEFVVKESDSNCFKVFNLTVMIPGTRKVLISDLTYDFSNGSLLVTGPSGVGKSSLFRVLSGLWDPAAGSIKKPKDSKILFVPQVPYMPIMKNNTLMAQLQFPGNKEGLLTLSEWKQLLDDLNLAHLANREKEEFTDWSNELSLGEQQRLGFGRVFTNKPQFVFLDESTSALDEENEKNLYSRLAAHNISYVSIGHRSSLVRYHSKVLLLRGNGKWDILKAEEYSKLNAIA